MTERPADNSGQAAFWTEQAGPTWARRHTALDATLAPVLDAVLDRAALQPGEAVLDIGCGAGGSTRRAAAAVAPDGTVLGVDISSTLLDTAAADPAPGADYLLADAQTHGFATRHFDAAISRFGVMFFADTAAAFANIVSGLKPGARLVMAAWAAPARNPWFVVPANAATLHFGPAPKTDRTLPGPFAWEDAGRILPLLDAAGLRDVAATPCPVTLTPAGDPAAEADLLCDIGPAQSRLRAEAGSLADRDALRTLIAEGLAPFMTDRLRIPAEIILYTARTPG